MVASKVEVSRGERTWLGVWSLPAVDAILEALLISKARISFAELDVGDVGIDLFIFADRQTVEGMIVTIGGELFALEIGWLFADGDQILFRTLQHRLEVFVILAGESFRRENDLMLGIDQGLGVVPLNDAVRGGHLHRFVIDCIALDLFAVAAQLGFPIL